MKKLVALFVLVGCGGSATVSNTATNNTNIDSQNGESECKFECAPAEIGGVTGYAVTQVCSGVISNGPNFFQDAPVGCVFPAGEEEVASFSAPEQEEETNTGGLSQEVL